MNRVRIGDDISQISFTVSGCIVINVLAIKLQQLVGANASSVKFFNFVHNVHFQPS